METLTKAKIVENLFESVGLSKNESAEVLDIMLKIILKTLSEGKQMKISNFGTFKLRVKNPRIGRNPKTREKKEISKRNVVLFKPSKEFKILINSKNNE